MRHCSLLLFLLVCTIFAFPQSKSDSHASISQTLEALEQKWLNAEKNYDAVAFEKIVEDDWIAITPDGKRQTKADRAAEIKSAI